MIGSSKGSIREKIMEERKKITGGSCVSCGNGHVFFFDERTEDGPDGHRHLADLICARCGVSQFQGCFDYHKRDMEPEAGPLCDGGDQEPLDQSAQDQLTLDFGS